MAAELKSAGADILWGGAYKSRTSPYSFQGLRAEGLKMLAAAKRATGLPVAAEMTDISQLDSFSDMDIIIVGGRNMQNYELLKTLGACGKPVILKRGVSSTYEELLMSAEYIMSGGNAEVILCERGIRTFENSTAHTFDVTAIPVLRQLSHLPVIADPSNASGRAGLVSALSGAAAAAGANGLMLTVHNDPAHAMCDGPMSLKPDSFAALAKKLRKLCELRLTE